MMMTMMSMVMTMVVSNDDVAMRLRGADNDDNDANVNDYFK